MSAYSHFRPIQTRSKISSNVKEPDLITRFAHGFFEETFNEVFFNLLASTPFILSVLSLGQILQSCDRLSQRVAAPAAAQEAGSEADAVVADFIHAIHFIWSHCKRKVTTKFGTIPPIAT